MELIYLTSDLSEIGPCRADVDFDVGNDATNDFVLKGILPDGIGGVYVPGTEFGGLLEYLQMSNRNDVVTRKGYTWRGLLEKGVIMPLAGSDYRIVSGDANAVISSLLSGFMGGFFHVPETASGITIDNYKFPLYCTYLEGLTGMLREHGAKLVITADKPAAGSGPVVTVQAKSRVTIGDKYSEEFPVSLTYTDDGMGINHLICLGPGELQHRTRVDLYVQEDGSIGTQQYYTGFRERTEVYDYSNSESESNLVTYGKRRLRERMSKKTLQLNNADVDGDIGDLVYGYMNGISTMNQITRKILTVTGGTWKRESKIEGVS
jgi:hypothetical protein